MTTLAHQAAKVCTKCGEAKPATVEWFYALRSGLTAECKECLKKRGRQYRDEHREVELERKRQYYAEHREEDNERSRRYQTEHRDTVLEQKRQYSAEHREERREYQRRYRAEHPEQMWKWLAEHAEYHQQYYASHQEEYAAHVRKRRARRAGAGGSHTIEDVKRLYQAQNGCCFYCGTELNGKYDVDHKIPLSRGGTDWPDNLCCACEPCNSRKRTKTAEEFLLQLAV